MYVYVCTVFRCNIFSSFVPSNLFSSLSNLASLISTSAAAIWSHNLLIDNSPRSSADRKPTYSMATWSPSWCCLGDHYTHSGDCYEAPREAPGGVSLALIAAWTSSPTGSWRVVKLLMILSAVLQITGAPPPPWRSTREAAAAAGGGGGGEGGGKVSKRSFTYFQVGSNH